MLPELTDIPTNRREIGAFLYQLVRLRRPAVVVDLGTAYGYTALCMGQAIKDIHTQLHKRKYHPYQGQVYTVDFYQQGQQDQVYNAIVKYDMLTIVTQLHGSATTVGQAWANGEIDVLYVDLTNTQPELFDVWDAWSQHLRGGGLAIVVKYPHKNVDDFYEYLYDTYCDVISIPTHVEQLELCLVSRE